MNYTKVILYATASIFTLLLAFSAVYTTDQGERGVVLRNGAFKSVAEPGLEFKLPIVDSVVFISVQEQSSLYEGVQAYSKDQQTGTMRMSVSYQVTPDAVAQVYEEYGSISAMTSRLLDRQVSKTMEEVFGQYNAITAVQERARLGKDIQTAIQKAVEGYPITVKSVQLENIDFSSAYEDSIEQRMKAEVAVKTAEQEALKAKIEADRDASVKNIQANASAEARLTTAKAEAEAIKLQGDAEASAIRAKSAALADNPNLTNLIQAEKWDGVLPTTMIPGATIPMLNIK